MKEVSPLEAYCFLGVRGLSKPHRGDIHSPHVWSSWKTP